MAANECGTGVVVTCAPAGNPYPNGITYFPSLNVDQTINLPSGVVVNSTGSYYSGVSVFQSGSGAITVNGPTGVSITSGSGALAGVALFGTYGPIDANISQISTTGDNVFGLISGTVSGAVNLTAGTVTTTGANAVGVEAETNSADIAINVGNVTTSGAGATGILAASINSGSGNVLVTAGSVATSGAGSDGISAYTTFGTVQVNATSVSTTGANSRGIFANSLTQTASVTSGSVVTTGANATGIQINSAFNGEGGALVDSGTVSATGVGSKGIVVYGNLNETITSGAVTANSTGILATTIPVFQFGPPTEAGNISVSTTGNITSATADAIDVTSAVGSITVTTAAGTTLSAAGAGIKAVSEGVGNGGTDGVGNGNLTVTSNGAIGTSATPVGGDGIDATISNAGSLGVINVTAASVYANGAGIVALNQGSGSVSVTANNVLSNGVGIDAEAPGAGASVTVNAGAVQTTGLAGSVFGPSSTGILARTSNGQIGIVAGSVSTVGAYASGVSAQSYSGSINVAAGTVTTTGTGADGVSATSNYGGNVSVSTTHVSTAGQGSNGVYALARQGSITISGGNIATQGFDARGIYAYAGKGATVAFGAISTGGDFATGVDAETATGNVAVSGTSVTTSGVDALGVYATSKTGDASVNVGSVTTTGGNGIGIDVQAPLGAANVTVGSVTTSGAIGAAGVIANGVSAQVISTGSIRTVGTTEYGDSGTGVLVTSTTGLASATVNNVTTSGSAARGLDIESAAGPVQVAINGAVSSAQADGVYAKTAATQPITVSLAAGGSVSAPSAFAIDTAGGPATVANAGTINGAIRLAGGGDVVNNSGVFNAVGDSIFAAAGGGAVGGDVFNNSGVLNILPGAGAAGNVTFQQLGSFNNSGLVSLSNGHVGDTFTLPGNFNGGPGSLLALDVNLAGIGTQTSCATTPLADCLVLRGGTATGVTGVRITNIPTGPSGLNSTGLVVVDAPGGSIAPGAFVISPSSPGFESRGGQGAVSSGFFFYRLVPVGTTQEALVSAPDNTAFEFVQFGAAATDIWYATTGTWFDREADLRNGATDDAVSGGRGDVWLKAFGDWSRRGSTQSTTSLGTTFTFDTSYRQNTGAIIGGVDLLRTGNRALVFGVDGGYVDSEVNFVNSPTTAKLSGGVVGGYASILAGPWYLDATVNYNILTLRDSIPTVPNPAGAGLFSTSGGVRSLGGQVETGWRIPLGSVAVEPLASLAYVRTTFDNLTIPGGDVQFNDVKSFRGSLGVRLSSKFQVEDYKVQPSIYARAWDEFNGDEGTSLINAGPSVLAGDRFRGVFGNVGGQVAVFTREGVSAFINGDYKFKSNYRDYTASVGIRYRF